MAAVGTFLSDLVTVAAQEPMKVGAAVAVIILATAGTGALLYVADDGGDSEPEITIADAACRSVTDGNDKIWLRIENAGDVPVTGTPTEVVVNQKSGSVATEFMGLNWSGYRFTEPGETADIVLGMEDALHAYRVDMGTAYTIAVYLPHEEAEVTCRARDDWPDQAPDELTGGNTSSNDTSVSTGQDMNDTLTITDILQNETQDAADSDDGTAPTVQLEYNDERWETTAQQIPVQCTDAMSGCRFIEWRLFDTTGNLLQYNRTSENTTHVPVGDEYSGKLEIQYRAVDHAGNLASWQSQTVRVDTQPPSTGIATSDNWYSTNFVQDVDDTAGPSGLSHCEYRTKDGNTAWSTWKDRDCMSVPITVGENDSKECTVEGEDTCTVQVRVWNNAGVNATDTASFNINYTNVTGNNSGDDNETTDESDWYTYDIATTSDWNQGTFDGTSADRGDNSGDLGIGYLNGTNPAATRLEDGLVGYWRLDRSSGDVLDYSGNRIDGSVAGTVDRGVTGIFGTEAVQLDGSSGRYIDLGSPEALDHSGESAVTISAWAYWNGKDDSRVYSNALYEELIWFNPNGYLAFTLWSESGEKNNIYTSSDPYVNEWVHLVGTYDGTEMRFYVNGEEKASKTASFTVNDANDNNVVIGAKPDGNGVFDGRIDEVRVYDRSLSTAEVQELYLSGRPFAGEYTHTVDTDHKNNWSTVHVDATVPDDTGVDLVFDAVDSTGAVIDTDTISLSDGAANHTVNVQGSEDARITVTGDTQSAEQTWDISDITVYYNR